MAGVSGRLRSLGLVHALVTRKLSDQGSAIARNTIVPTIATAMRRNHDLRRGAIVCGSSWGSSIRLRLAHASSDKTAQRNPMPMNPIGPNSQPAAATALAIPSCDAPFLSAMYVGRSSGVTISVTRA